MRIALLALLLTTSSAIAAGVPAKPGEPYLQARKQMLAAGYTGHQTKDISTGCGIGFEDVCRDYPEALTCRGTGMSGCSYVFWRDDQPVLVETVGEQVPMQKVKRVKVLTVAEQIKLFPVDRK